MKFDELLKGDLRKALLCLSEMSVEEMASALESLRKWARKEKAGDRLHNASEALKQLDYIRCEASEAVENGESILQLFDAEEAFERGSQEYQEAYEAWQRIK